MAGKEPPTLTVVAGQNGAGKSTLVAAMTAEGYDFGPLVNPDVIAAKLPAGTANRSTKPASSLSKRHASTLGRHDPSRKKRR